MNNYFKNCPAKMEDGRFITDYRPAHQRELYYMDVNKIYDHNEFRNFLQKNTKTIMNEEWDFYSKNNSCHNYGCFHNENLRTSVKDMYDEMTNYNILKKVNLQPKCRKLDDYRLYDQ